MMAYWRHRQDAACRVWLFPSLANLDVDFCIELLGLCNHAVQALVLKFRAVTLFTAVPCARGLHT